MTQTNHKPLPANVTDVADHPGIAVILSALDRLRFGVINITVHEGRLVQVDVTERSRFQA